MIFTSNSMIIICMNFFDIPVIILRCFFFREVLECPSCGVIFRSRQNWYGNKEVEEIVHTEIRHVWPDVSLHQTEPGSKSHLLT